jgi:TPR repeat protein
VDQSFEKAYEWFKVASDNGYMSATYRLALMYRNGDHVDRSYEEAFRLFLDSAEKGHELAQFELSRMYRDGVGVEKSVELADKWFDLYDEQRRYNELYPI